MPTKPARLQSDYQLATTWRFFPAEPYAITVLADAPLLNGQIFVKRVEQLRHLTHLRNLRWTYVHLDSDIQVTELDFLRYARNLSQLEVHLKDGNGVDLSPLSSLPALESLGLQGMREVDLRPLANPPAPLTIQISRAVKVSSRDTLMPHVTVKDRH